MRWPSLPGGLLALLLASTVVPILGWSGITMPVPGTEGNVVEPAEPIQVIALVALLCWPLCSRPAVWQSCVGTSLRLVVPFLPTLLIGGLVVASHVGPLQAPSLDSGLAALLWTLLVGGLLFVTANRAYAHTATVDHRPFAEWEAGATASRRRRRIAYTLVAAPVLGLVVQFGLEFLTGEPPTVGWSEVTSLVTVVLVTGGIALLAGRDIQDTKRYAAFEHGLWIDGNLFVRRADVSGYEETDSEVIVELQWPVPNRALRRADLDRPDAVVAALDRLASHPGPVRTDGEHSGW